MKDNATVTIILSVITVICCMILNFQEFLMGNTATIKNLIVTVAYLSIWILILIIGTKIKSRGIMKYCSVFWSATFFFAIITAYINATGVTADLVIPFVILFLGQWYGIDYFVGSFLFESIIIAFISLIMFTITVISLKHTKEA